MAEAAKKRKAKGEGSYKYNPDGKVTLRKSVGVKADGKRKILTVTAANEAQCVRLMKQKETRWNKEKNRLLVTGGITVEELCRKHLDYQVSQRELMPKSIDRREGTINNQIGNYAFGKIQAQALRSSDVDNHINDLLGENKLSVSSISKVLDVVNAAYNWAVSRDELDYNPVSQIKGSIVKKLSKVESKTSDDADVVVLSDEEMEQFISEASKVDDKGNPAYAASLSGLFLLYTGIRCGECFSLRWRDYDAENGLLTIEKSMSMAKNRSEDKRDGDSNYISIEGSTKNKKARVIQLLPEAIDVLNKTKGIVGKVNPDDLIFPTRTGKNNTASNLEHRMQTIYKNAGLSEDISGLHIMRRTFATRRYEEGWRVKDIAAYIGDLESTTEKYYIAIRKKKSVDGKVKQYVPIPTICK